jgi:hypothetical protein
MKESTGEKIEATTWQHFVYFFFTEEEEFGKIYIINLVISCSLTWFSYNTLLEIYNNVTTNEKYKRAQFAKSLPRQKIVIERLI